MAAKKALKLKPATYEADPRDVRFREPALETAMDAVEGLIEPGCRVLGITGGHYSLLDLIRAVLAEVGPADVIVSTWTAGLKDVQHASFLLDEGHIQSLLLLTDRSFPTRQPEYCAEVCRLFGRESVIMAQTHAKFALVSTDEHQVCIRTSMNLNQNPRLEYWELDDDPKMYGWFRSLVDELVARTTPGSGPAHAEVISAYEMALEALNRTATVAEYAKHRGVTVRAVNLALQEGRCPKNSDGTIPVVEADKAWPKKSRRDPTVLRRERRNAAGDVEVEEVTLHEAKLRFELARAEKIERENEERDGKTMPRAEVEAAIDRSGGVIQAWCKALPGRVAQRIAAVTGAETSAVRRIVASEITALQSELAEALEGLGPIMKGE